MAVDTPAIQLVLCDLDGTLVDTVPDLHTAVNAVMQHLNRAEWDEDRVRSWVGNGAERLVKRALTGSMTDEPESALLQQAMPVFNTAYAEHVSDSSVPFPGVRDGIDWMRAQPFHLACVTNKPEAFTLPLLKGLGLLDAFELILSGDSLPKKKPDPMPLNHAARHFGVDPAACLLIGDSVNDVKAARAAGYQTWCVPYGYNHGNPIEDAAPDRVIPDFSVLSSLLS